MGDFLQLSLTLKLKRIIMENVALSIKYPDFQGYVYSKAFFTSCLLHELYLYIVSELQEQRKRKRCKKIDKCVCVHASAGACLPF